MAARFLDDDTDLLDLFAGETLDASVLNAFLNAPDADDAGMYAALSSSSAGETSHITSSTQPARPARKTAAHGKAVSPAEASDDDDEDYIGGEGRSGSPRSATTVRKGDPNRGAKMAKLNRDRHKAYVSSLEATNARLTKDMAAQAARTSELEAALAHARSEIAQLKETIANQSAISTALAHIGHNITLAFSNSAATMDAGSKRRADDDGEPTSKRPMITVPLQFNITMPM